MKNWIFPRFVDTHSLWFLRQRPAGEVIAAAVGIGFSTNSFGVIMEYSGCCEQKEAEEKIQFMLEERLPATGD